MYAITRHQPWESLIAPGIKTVETRPWPAAARLVGLTIAIHAGQRVVKGPGDVAAKFRKVLFPPNPVCIVAISRLL